ncbi:hypothetical protein [uncultured Polaribacter sp.]|uniref:hypothetical protein n=1 Tax=uncultured Polaribacter sp. TaxID=174711 RepID=UPI00261A2C4F|nr:hypothetical protein [uncultured Polaribacter sp.]
MLKKVLILFFIMVCYSCANRNGHLFSFNIPDYNYDYYNPNKRINVKDNYILNVISVQTQNGFRKQNLKSVQEYFSNKLDNNVSFVNQVRDKNGKILLKSSFPYNISKTDLEILSKTTNFDFIILSKIEYLEFLDKKSLSQNNKARLISASAGAIATVKIIDLKNNDVILEMSCTASVNDPKYHFEEEIDHQGPVIGTIPVHRNSFNLAKKAIKKLLKKIK